jgi:hypothetical protein
MSSLKMHLGPKAQQLKNKKACYSKINACGSWIWWHRPSIPATQEGEVGGRSQSETFPRQKQALFEGWGMAQVLKLLASRP